ncbi:Outer membrane protein TolC [Desulfocicer vacuolatum DSM 3385]|uniref:Outer membrane protein TolC n=2 Tax=Desulfocicer vacuolatum TaxID=2298 RepID=A0A1W2DZB3_9BACT|nr:Outer membrane protein TolC [Desulfocicer vacuolatum DSM 3385]
MHCFRWVDALILMASIINQEMLDNIIIEQKDLHMRLRFWSFILLWVLLMAIPSSAWSEKVFKIALLMGAGEETVYQGQITQEINTLLESRVKVKYLKVQIDERLDMVDNTISKLMQDSSIDCVIGIGLDASAFLVRRGSYAKPTIAATILDRQIQGLPLTPRGTSGIRHFNYILSPFDVEKDLQTFRSIYPYKHLAVLMPAGETVMFHALYSYFGKAMETVSPDAKLSIVEIDPNDIDGSMSGIPERADAAYVLPLFPQCQVDREQALIHGVNRKGLPSFALAGESHVKMGAMASIAPERNFNAMIRRIAINVLEIMDGRDAGTLPVNVSAYADNFVVNVATLRKIDIYPGFKVLEKARLLNLDKLRQGREVNLKGVILEALERNLDLQMEKTDTKLQAKAVNVAASQLRPQINLSSSLTHVDENQVDIAGTVAARTSWSTTGQFTQTLFSDDILANYAIQKIILESRRYQEKAALLDTVLTAAQAYITLLSARTNQAIQNNNLKVTRTNLDLARNKVAVGSVDASEVNRWESEEATGQMALNDAHRDLELAGMALNQLLDRPITREFSPRDIEPDTAIELMVTDPEIYGLVENFKQLERFSNFLIQESNANLPELKQIAQSLKSEERRLLNRRRALYLPDVALTGRMDNIMDEYDAPRGTPSDLDHPWSLSLTATWPLYSGGIRKSELAQSRIQVGRIQMEEKNLRSRLHLEVRSRLQTAAVSAREIDLAERSRRSAKKSFEIIQAGYAQGRNSVTDLVDAQNAMVTSERSAALSKYQFVLDFLSLERAIGGFYFLKSPEQKAHFMDELRKYMAAS